MGNEHKTFQITSIESPKEGLTTTLLPSTRMSRKKLGQIAAIGLLGGYIVSGSVEVLRGAFGTTGSFVGYVLGEFLSLVGLVSFLMWLYKIIRRQ